MAYHISDWYIAFRICFCVFDFTLALVIAYYLVTKMAYLHGNFRCLVFANCVACFIVSTSLICFLCAQMMDLHGLLDIATVVYFFGLYGDAFTTIFMTFERGIATLKAKNYEERRAGVLANFLLFSSPFISSALFIFIYDSGIIPLADLINSLFFAFIAFLCLVESILIYRYNQKILRVRNNSDLSLSARFQYSENFSLSKVFLVVTGNDLLTWITLAVLYYYASAMESVSLIDSDGNIFLDLGDSVYLEKCLVLYSALLISQRKYEARSRRIRPQNRHSTSKIHFEHLANSWEHHYISYIKR